MKKWFGFGLCLMAAVLVVGWSGVGTSFAACPVVGCTVCIDATTSPPSCTYLDEDGDPHTVTAATLDAKLAVASSDTPNVNAYCKDSIVRDAAGAAGEKGPAVGFDTTNTDDGLCCIVTTTQTYQTNDWSETVSGSGNVSLSCHFPGTE